MWTTTAIHYSDVLICLGILACVKTCMAGFSNVEQRSFSSCKSHNYQYNRFPTFDRAPPPRVISERIVVKADVRQKQSCNTRLFTSSINQVHNHHTNRVYLKTLEYTAVSIFSKNLPITILILDSGRSASILPIFAAAV